MTALFIEGVPLAAHLVAFIIAAVVGGIAYLYLVCFLDGRRFRLGAYVCMRADVRGSGVCWNDLQLACAQLLENVDFAENPYT